MEGGPVSEPVHLNSPFAFNSKGIAQTVVQESSGDRLARAYNVCVCIQGEREDNPAFGIPDLTFSTLPVNWQPLQTAIERWAGVSLTLEETEAAYVAARNITIGVS